MEGGWQTLARFSRLFSVFGAMLQTSEVAGGVRILHT
jgi:hypothetical protein